MDHMDHLHNLSAILNVEEIEWYHLFADSNVMVTRLPGCKALIDKSIKTPFSMGREKEHVLNLAL